MELGISSRKIHSITLTSQEEVKVLHAGVSHFLKPPVIFHPMRRSTYFRFADHVQTTAQLNPDSFEPIHISGKELAIAMAGFTAVADEVLNLRDHIAYTTNTPERDAVALAISSDLQQATQ